MSDPCNVQTKLAVNIFFRKKTEVFSRQLILFDGKFLPA